MCEVLAEFGSEAQALAFEASLINVTDPMSYNLVEGHGRGERASGTGLHVHNPSLVG